jgi:tetratricopeptide (TPR) repeat protein
MRIRTAALKLFCLFFAAAIAGPALAQDMPQECKEGLESRSPQAQVDLFSSCLETGRLRGDDKVTTLKQRAVAYMHLGRHQLALEDINQALKIKSDDSDLFYLRGFAYRALGQYQRAIEDSNRAIGLESDFAAAFANRAFANQALGNINQARSDARRAKELDPKVKVPRF